VTQALLEGSPALLTDLYQLTMLQAYFREGLRGEAVFSLFFRKLPARRNFALACGVDAALSALESLRFSAHDLEALGRLRLLGSDCLAELRELRFTGDVFALPEGTPVFPGEPLLEVVAPLPEAQLAESLLMNQVHLETVLASKAARVVAAARGRPVVDFALRRMHGCDAALRGARAFYLAGVESTSHVLAGLRYGIPLAGTMAHSYIQAHASEAAAFRAFAALYPETILLVDTYDTLAGVRAVAALARELGDAFRVRGVRLDSGDLGALAAESRRILDAAGLAHVQIFASGDLDEDRIAALLEQDAPIDAFGVGTRMGVSADAPSLDLAYKLTAYAGEGRLKTSAGKAVLPGRKQVFRVEEDGVARRDVLAREGERGPGRPLLVPVMRRGRRVGPGAEGVAEGRRRAREEIARLPERVRALAPADPPYPVEVSAALSEYAASVRERVSR
jgi:nicotinate phosphoribosyltransferase